MPASKRVIDFTNVKEQGDFNQPHKPAGDYRAKVTKVDEGESKAGNEQWIFTIILTDDRRATYPYYCGMESRQAWKIRNLLMAAGLKVPKKKVAVNPEIVVGKEIGITLDDDEYDGRKKSIIVQTFPTSELDEGPDDIDDEDLEPEEPKKKSTKKRRVVEDDDDDVDELDLEEL